MATDAQDLFWLRGTISGPRGVREIASRADRNHYQSTLNSLHCRYLISPDDTPQITLSTHSIVKGDPVAAYFPTRQVFQTKPIVDDIKTGKVLHIVVAASRGLFVPGLVRPHERAGASPHAYSIGQQPLGMQSGKKWTTGEVPWVAAYPDCLASEGKYTESSGARTLYSGAHYGGHTFGAAHSAAYYNEQPAAIVTQPYANDQWSMPYARLHKYNVTGALPAGTIAGSLTLTETNLVRPVFVQNGRLLLAPEVDPIKLVIDMGSNGVYNPDNSGLNLRWYRGEGNNLTENSKYGQMVTIYQSSTWRDVTNYPTITNAEIDMSNDGTPTLLGYGTEYDAPYGVGAAENQCLLPSMGFPNIEIIFRTSDDDVRRVYQDMTGTSARNDCKYAWQPLPPTYTSFDWVQVSNNCKSGFSPVPPATLGTFMGEQRSGTCSI